MVSITQGYNKGCKNSIGGVKKAYFFTYYKYARSLIDVTNGILNSFPLTVIYEFDGFENSAFSESMSEEDGGKFIDQRVNFEFKNTGLNYLDFQKLLKKDIRIIIQDYNDNFRILGLYNGLEVTNLKSDIGSGKNTLNGYSFDAEGKEINYAPFITDLESAGFFIGSFDYLLLEDGFYLLQEDNNKIIL